MRGHAPGTGAREGKLDAACEPLLEFAQRFLRRDDEIGLRRFGSGDLLLRLGRLQPVARFFLDRDVQARVEPPAQSAPRLGIADGIYFPAHVALPRLPLTARSRKWEGK